MIENLTDTTFRLHGLPTGLYDSLDDEALYSGDEEGGSERSRDLYGAWLFDRDYDTFTDEAGNKKRWYSGMGWPAPANRVTREMEPALQREFFLDRIRAAAQALPEGAWLVSKGWWDDAWLETYQRNGSIVIELEERRATMFKLTF